MTSSYNQGLVALSVLIAIFASYAALDLAGRTRAARGASRWIWLTGGATAMGLGILLGEAAIDASSALLG